jgi:hypothetical protein
MSVDFPDWSEAKSFAIELSQIGAPLLRLTRNLGFANVTQNLFPNTQVNLVSLASIDQPGYEGQFKLWFDLGVGTNPFAALVITWTDSVSNEAVATDTFFMSAGNDTPNQLTYYMSGPAKGDLVTIALLNLDPAAILRYTYTFGVNSHIYTWDRIIMPNYTPQPPIGFTNPNGTPGVGLIAIMSPSTGPGATSTRLLAVYNGKVRLNVNNIGQANACEVHLQDPNQLYSATAGGVFFATTVAAGGTFNTELVLPNGPVVLTSKNTGGAGNISTVVSVIKEEY